MVSTEFLFGRLFRPEGPAVSSHARKGVDCISLGSLSAEGAALQSLHRATVGSALTDGPLGLVKNNDQDQIKTKAKDRRPRMLSDSETAVMIFDFRDRRERDLYNFTVCALHLDARCSQCLSSLHAAHNAAHALSINRDDLYVVLAVKGL